ncbi:MAG: hypothetical protein NZ108_03555 [Bacteroidia bacterium]|nr:hypothetical protein [Bacteroidia bacterium]
MGKRLIRLQPFQFSKEKFQDLPGKEIDILLKSGQTLHGICLEISESVISIRDENALWYNLRKHHHQVPLTNIREILWTSES